VPGRRLLSPADDLLNLLADRHQADPQSRLPEQLATGPRVLRAYRADDTMNYDHNTVVTDQADLKPIIEGLLSEPDVATVHVRTLAPQCFLYAVAAV